MRGIPLTTLCHPSIAPTSAHALLYSSTPQRTQGGHHPPKKQLHRPLSEGNPSSFTFPRKTLSGNHTGTNNQIPAADGCDAVALQCATMPQATATEHRRVHPHPPHTTPVAPPAHPPPQSRRASDPSRQQPCHPPLALAPRRLYTSPMPNPTSACYPMPHPARGTSQRSTNCPESGPPYPQNGSCWTKRIVSAADRFEADSFPKKENLGIQSNRRSSARPEGHPREGGNPG